MDNMAKNKLVIIGNGGHGKVCADIALQKYDEVKFLDDNDSTDSIGRVSDYYKYTEEYDFFVAIGNNSVRERISSELKGANIVSLVHNDAVVAKDVKIGIGTVVMAGAVINPDVKIGRGCIVNTCSSLDHSDEVGDFSHISVGAHVAGDVKIGKKVTVGAGAIVINNITVCDECFLGAGAVLVANANIKGLYTGVPAKLKRGETI